MKSETVATVETGSGTHLPEPAPLLLMFYGTVCLTVGNWLFERGVKRMAGAGQKVTLARGLGE